MDRVGLAPDAAPPGRQLARIARIPIRFTAGSLLIGAWLVLLYARVLSSRFPELGGAHWPLTLLFPAAFAASVLLHELGHALLGRKCGLGVRWIVLDGLGGQTEFDADAPSPGRSALVAAAGPAVSVALALLLGAAAATVPAGTATHFVLLQIAFGNAVVAAFNLLPGLPLDGGYLLRALVWKLSGNSRAGTVVSAVTGVVSAAAIFIVPIGLLMNAGARAGLFGISILLVIAAPIGVGACSILREERQQSRHPLPTAHDLARPAVAIHPAQPVQEAIRVLTARAAAALLVTDAWGAVIGIVGEADLARVPAHNRELVTAGELAHPLTAGQLVPPSLAGDLLRTHLRAAGAAILLLDYGDRRVPRVLLADDVLGQEDVVPGPSPAVTR